jgi:hypothetical protein
VFVIAVPLAALAGRWFPHHTERMTVAFGVWLPVIRITDRWWTARAGAPA